MAIRTQQPGALLVVASAEAREEAEVRREAHDARAALAPDQLAIVGFVENPS